MKLRLPRPGLRSAAIAPLLAAALVLGACPPGAESPGTASEERTAVVAYGVDILGVNELLHRRTAAQTALLLYAIYQPLLEEQGDVHDGPPTFEPRLAERYEFSEDRLALTFYLRPDAVWSDGVPITAEDVRWTWRAQVDPDVAWDYAAAKNRISDVEVIDEHTVRFHFTEVYASQLLDANEGVILPRHAWSELPFSEWRGASAWFDRRAVSSGPFVLESWLPSERFVLERNPRYFNPEFPDLDRVVFLVTPSLDARLSLLKAGTVHLTEIDPPAGSTIEEAADLELLTYVPRQFVFISWNTARPLFAEAAVRRALTLGIDRRTIIETLYYGYADVTASPYPSDSWVFHPDLEPLPYDPARARELLAEAGWRDTDGDGVVDRDGIPFRFELLTNNDNRLRTDMQVMIENQLGQLGIEVMPRAIEFNALGERLFGHDFDAAINAVRIDTSLNLYFNFHSGPDAEFNWGRYSNPEVDRVIDEINEHLDPVTAKPLYWKLQELLHQDQPLTILYEPRRLVAVREDLENVHPDALSTFANLREWRLAAIPDRP